uniref:Putative secreted protein n=1 Tax=Streptomyces ambofaciens (strain ATCC 23877 / 3486 / DSM 40053 / JCM 4204 / NBRC 12836 / NRRL B-2516) TaxID=278992 RepID=Q1RR57_STRA7|nr:putative secreted protein [Streptomyces ambofaciens ATCC 23877]CAI78231.1 putative secreted protein [Streptomyces ambofaciens ATCC 23877]CAJ87738.1 putative secreted protein [Streptomyces ambofaciens ATCC 23877]CAJ89016.1 putative secreted protein [Streptomyces ambofaciens ATCC 23877]
MVPTSAVGEWVGARAGAYADPTGLYEMEHRYYDPTLGRFTQPDPSGQETNPYLYVSGDPINPADPSGLCFCVNALGKAAGGVVCASKEVRKKVNKGATVDTVGTAVCAAAAGPTPVGAGCGAVGAAAGVVSFVTME